MQLQTPKASAFFHAFSLVSSRAFVVDAYHGLSMVPIADAFNHIIDNHVHLEVKATAIDYSHIDETHAQSDYDVCPECGAVDECTHDQNEGTSVAGIAGTPAMSPSLKPTYDMVTNTGVPPGEEVFNTYGETLNNAQLLCQYGFQLDINDNDLVTFSDDQLPLTEYAMDFEQLQLLNSALIMHSTQCAIDSDGRISSAFWLRATHLLGVDTAKATQDLIAYETQEEHGVPSSLKQVATFIVSLCEHHQVPDAISVSDVSCSSFHHLRANLIIFL
jgi:hypothetical protein